MEGDDDKKIVSTLKTDMQLIIPGKVEKFNVIEKQISKTQVMNLKKDTTVILVFDTDTGKTGILEKNIDFLNRQKVIKDVIYITQVLNLEDELVRSCTIRQIRELTKSRSNKDFKKDVLRISNLKYRLKECRFDLKKFWSVSPENEFKDFINRAEKIKIPGR